MADLATLQQRLTEAETARHQILIGSKAEMVDMSNGQRVTYTRVNVDKLDAYIADLRAQIAAETGVATGGRRRAFTVTM
jgi:hypothetical protein